MNILGSSAMAFYWVVVSLSVGSVTYDLEGAEHWVKWVFFGRRRIPIPCAIDWYDPEPFPSYRYAMACARALRDMGQIVQLIRLP
jgi:hypothetical protein